jgi:glycosyltransferase involved in cell wall biosynthesis
LVVLHVVAPGEVGGLEAVVQALVLGARAAGVEARVAAILPDGALGHPFLLPLARAGVEAFVIAAGGRAYWRERRAVASLCRRLRPDVVHTHGYRADVLDAPVARALGIPVVTTVHGFTGGDWKNRCYQWLQRRAWRRFDAVVAVSRRLADELRRGGLPSSRVHLVRNAWRSPAPLLERPAARAALGDGNGDPAPGDACLGWVGRLSREKGPDVLLEALARLRGRPWRACLVGDGPDRAALVRRAAALGLGDRVHWHGAVADAGRLYRAFDVFVLSSRTEGTPMALFEAMASEVPIVAAAVGGVPEVVSAAEAVLVPPGDPAALAAALAGVLDDPAAARRRAGRARERLEREFRAEAWLRRYAAIYRAVSGRERRGPERSRAAAWVR